MLKRVQEWKKIPVDSAVLSFHHLQGYYWNEWQQGLSVLLFILSTSNEKIFKNVKRYRDGEKVMKQEG